MHTLTQTHTHMHLHPINTYYYTNTHACKNYKGRGGGRQLTVIGLPSAKEKSLQRSPVTAKLAEEVEDTGSVSRASGDSRGVTVAKRMRWESQQGCWGVSSGFELCVGDKVLGVLCAEMRGGSARMANQRRGQDDCVVLVWCGKWGRPREDMGCWRGYRARLPWGGAMGECSDGVQADAMAVWGVLGVVGTAPA